MTIEPRSGRSGSDLLTSELGARPREVFRHLVEAYLTLGEPVGSRTLSQRLPLSLSPASIRNIMSDLEQLGLLYAPHTSAGRVPTERGLRLFVDGMLQIGDLTSEERGAIEERLAAAGRPLEDVMTQAAKCCRASRAALDSSSRQNKRLRSSMSSS